MIKSWALFGWALGFISNCSAACDDVSSLINIPNPMTADMEINLDGVDTIECAEIEGSGVNEILLEKIVIDGGKVTLKSSSNVRFVNVMFDVKSGATLVFDMPKTKFGPNTARKEGEYYYNDFGMNVAEGATVTFMGKFVAKDVSNAFTAIYNVGSIEFQKMALFEDGTYAFYENQGTIKFRGNTVFRNNRFHALNNIFSGFIRFSKDAVFDGNAYEDDNFFGCGLSNTGDESRVVFRGDATFENHNCLGVALWNPRGTTKFYGKAYFNNNSRAATTSGGFNMNPKLGGAAIVSGGSVTFNGAAQFNNNSAGGVGGGIGIDGGEVIFKKWTTFEGNAADSGAAFALLGGALKFLNPTVTRFTDNKVFVDEYPIEESCTVGLQPAETSESFLDGFPGDDICVPPTDA